MMSREEFVSEAVKRGYRNGAEVLFEAVYEAAWGLSEDHPYRKLMACITEGRSPVAGRADISCTDHPYLVTEDILNELEKQADGMGTSPRADALREAVSAYREDWMRERAEKEKEELPLWRAYSGLDEDKLKEAGRIAAKLLENGNKDSDELKNVAEAAKKLASIRCGAYFGSVLGRKQMQDMEAAGDAAESFIVSEKNIKDPDVTLALKLLGMVRPEKAAAYEKQTSEKNVSRNRINLETLSGGTEKKNTAIRERRTEKAAEQATVLRR